MGADRDFYRAELHLSALGAPDLEAFLRTGRVERFGRRHAADLPAQLRIWDAGDLSDHPRFGGNLAAALRGIQARVLLMPGEPDLHFRVADNEAELPHLGREALRPIPSMPGKPGGQPGRRGLPARRGQRLATAAGPAFPRRSRAHGRGTPAANMG